jgi:hypothetical protein
MVKLVGWLWRWADGAWMEVLYRWPPADRLPDEAQMRQLRCWLDSVCKELPSEAILPDRATTKYRSQCNRYSGGDLV